MKASLPNPNPRIRYKKNTVDGILNYDVDNIYPQRMREYCRASGTASNCIKTYAKFIRGGGFADKIFYKSVVNQLGQTADAILRKISNDISEFRGYALHVNYDGLARVSSVTHIPFEYCRLSLPDDYDVSPKIAVYDNWDKVKNKTIDIKRIDFIDKFNPEPEVVLTQVERAGGFENYKGQVLWVSLDGDQYPLAIYDSVIEDIIASAGTKTYRLRQTTTNFLASHIVEIPFQFESDEEREAQKEVFSDFQGVDKSNKLLMLENPDAADKDGGIKLHKVDIQDGDKMFQITNQTCKDSILEVFSMPPVLAGVQIPGKLGNQDMKDAYDFYNSVTIDERIMIEEDIKKIFSRFNKIINPTGNYSILPLAYV